MSDAQELIGLAETARRIKISGKSVSPPTVFRWIRHGVKVGEKTIFLRHIPLGSRLVTTPELIARFTQELETAAREATSSGAAPARPRVKQVRKRTKAQIERARKDAEEQLVAAGY